MEDSYSKENFRTYVQTLPPLDLDKATLGALRDRRELIRGYIDNLPKTPEGRPDLSGADLSGLNLAFADLFRVDLTEANLNGASLYQASITFARLENAIMRDADLRGVQALSAKLIGADITGARLDPIVAADNSLTYPNFVGAKLLRIKGLLGGGQDFDQKTPKRFIQITKDTTLIDYERPKEGRPDELLIFFLFNENLNNALDKYIENQATVDSPQENYSAVKGSIDNAIKEWERFFESCKPKSKESVVTVPLGDSFNLVLEAPDFDAWRNDIIGTISFQYGWIHTDLIEGDYPESYRWLESVRGQIHGNAAPLIGQIIENRSLG